MLETQSWAKRALRAQADGCRKQSVAKVALAKVAFLTKELHVWNRIRRAADAHGDDVIDSQVLAPAAHRAELTALSSDHRGAILGCPPRDRPRMRSLVD